MSELIPSISYSQHDIIRWITALHLGGRRIELDATYGRGNFYSPPDIKRPTFAYDNNPDLCTDSIAYVGVGRTHTVHLSDVTELPHTVGSIASAMFDPPFLIKTGDGSIMKDRFGEYPTMKALWEFYARALKELSRVLAVKGVLIVKCQNMVSSGKQQWSVNFIRDLANKYGLVTIDEFILLAKHRMSQHNLKQQRHARKYHSYFLVFRKAK